MTFIGISPSPEMIESGLEIDLQCARCGSSVLSEPCEYCEDGYDGHDCGEDCCPCLYPEDNRECQYCDGTGTWRLCMSSREWCLANPLPGRHRVDRGEVEWFTVEKP